MKRGRRLNRAFSTRAKKHPLKTRLFVVRLFGRDQSWISGWLRNGNLIVSVDDGITWIERRRANLT